MRTDIQTPLFVLSRSRHVRPMRGILLGCALLMGMIASTSHGAPPNEVSNVTATAGGELAWFADADADYYNVYRGFGRDLQAAIPPRCHGHPIESNSFPLRADPPPDQLFFYLVTAESIVEGEGSPGLESGGTPRNLLGRCTPVFRQHVLNRLGYGPDAWSLARYATLGPSGYLDEQLTPASIDESSNVPLNTALAAVTPPLNIIDLVGRNMVLAVHSRRQLEQSMAMFWANHFNTYNPKVTTPFFGLYPPCFTALPQCDPNYPEIAVGLGAEMQLRDIELFRGMSFRGNFREMLEASALGPAMMTYLDTLGSVAGAPNENYPRELLELYAMGVNGGYTQEDVEELSRVFTGWSFCKKAAGAEDPLDACILSYWSSPGEWTADFEPANHDCGEKRLFAGTNQEVVIPDTCATPDAGANDVELALDAIADHPSTASFISTKIVEKLVTEEPTDEMIAAVVAAWNDPSHLYGVGDMREVIRAALELPAFSNVDRVRNKIKTPFEQIASGTRALDGVSDGITLVPSLLLLHQHLPFYNPVPTGYSELGSKWIDTNNVLERQNFGVYLIAGGAPEFSADVNALLLNNGVSTAPGNSEAIIDFLAERLFGGAWTPGERAAAIEYLDTDDFGNPFPYDAAKIAEVTVFLLGFPHFQEQ